MSKKSTISGVKMNIESKIITATKFKDCIMATNADECKCKNYCSWDKIINECLPKSTDNKIKKL